MHVARECINFCARAHQFSRQSLARLHLAGIGKSREDVCVNSAYGVGVSCAVDIIIRAIHEAGGWFMILRIISPQTTSRGLKGPWGVLIVDFAEVGKTKIEYIGKPAHSRHRLNQVSCFSYKTIF